MMLTTDPRTGDSADTSLVATSTADVDAVVRRAADAAVTLRGRDRSFRAEILEAFADATAQARDDLVDAAESETGLGRPRLTGEVARCVGQFRLFAEAVREGSLVEAVIDHEADTPAGRGPDVRRMLIPIGPVAVFGASNFPFAFSVLGGDTASAIAAGCPVLLKAHGSHLLTSRLSHRILQEAAESIGAPEGLVGIVYGQRAGVDLVVHPKVKAASFTGSLHAARALMSAIDGREDPIPFFGELSSINPLVVSERAAAARGDEIAAGLFASYTGSAGQLCTKPGVAFVPTGEHGQRLVDALLEATASAEPQVLLNGRIHESFGEISGRLVSAGAGVAGRGVAVSEDQQGFLAAPTVLETPVGDLGADLAEECFGPLILVARYDDVSQVAEAMERMPSSLTSTLHLEEGEDDVFSALSATMEATSGRIVFNGFPTGVRVCWAQHHGGPWPATNSQHTSVGVTAARRFMRPVAWQDAPQAALPAELRDDATDVPRRVDGALQPADPR